jgi:hypothetical protein
MPWLSSISSFDNAMTLIRHSKMVFTSDAGKVCYFYACAGLVGFFPVDGRLCTGA